MKTKLILALCLLLSLSSYTQSPSWRWAQSFSSPDRAYAEGNTTDASGNVYLTGSYSPYLRIGDTIMGQDTNWSALIMDEEMYVAKYDSSGNVIWASRAHGNKEDRGIGVAVDAHQNVYVAGYFISDTFQIGPYSVLNHGPNLADIFLAKYDSTGRIQWLRSAGMENGETPYAVTVDPSGNIYIGGAFLSRKLVFGTDTLVNFTSTGTGTLQDIFIAKYDPNGNVLWSRRDGGNKGDVIYSLACDPAGNLYAGGFHYSASIRFDSITVSGSIYQHNNLMVSYTPSGSVRWAKGIYGGASAMETHAIAVDKDFNLYSTGSWQGYSRIVLGPGDTLPLHQNLEEVMFIMRQDSGGRYIWSDVSRSAQHTPTNAVRGFGIYADRSGGIYVSGFAYDSATIGGTLITNTTTNSYGFMVKLDSARHYAWTRTFGRGSSIGYTSQGNTPHKYFHVTGDNAGRIYLSCITGSSYIYFDSTVSIGIFSYSGNNSNDNGFLARLDAGGRASVFTTLYDTICPGSTVTVGTHSYAVSGLYTDVFTTAGGSDSTVTLHLYVRSQAQSTYGAAICSGSSYTFGGQHLTVAGTYHDTITAAHGCDSIVTLQLAIVQPVHSSLSASICSGSTYSYHGHTLSAAGTYTDTLTAASGCDSIVTLQLQVAATIRSSSAATICAGSTFAFGGQQLSAAGTYYDTLMAAAGCDSIVELVLHVTTPPVTTRYAYLCSGSAYIFGSQSLTVPGTYYDTLTTASGCDSVIVLELSSASPLQAAFVLQPSATPHQWYVVDQSVGYGLHYSWTWGDGSPASTGASSSHTYDSAGYYTICLSLTDTAACQAAYCDSNIYRYKDAATSMVYVSVVSEVPTGLATITTTTTLDLYPNPNTGTFTLATNVRTGDRYEVYDILGRPVQHGVISGDHTAIDLGAQQSGIYTITIGGAQHTAARFTIVAK